MTDSQTSDFSIAPPVRPREPRFSTVRNVTALVLREMSTRYGRTPGGYVWAVLEPFLAILILSIGFSLLLRSPSLGTSFLLFYATGYLILNLYQTLSNMTIKALRFSSSLLRFPTVAWIDAIIARALLNSLTSIVIMIVLLGTILTITDTRSVIDLAPIVEATGLTMLLGVGVGTLILVPAGLYPLFDVAWSVATRPLFISSAVIYIYEDLPRFAQEILWYNPLVHLTGLMRRGFYPSYQASYVSIPYVLFFGIITLFLGVVLCRRYHREVMAQFQ